ncbi:hypothetical protein L596_013205 [Steinernema carpocapsae]|uniref:BTB domain-containing protein n=1 Tax=Steinernema carpocapsae TaxID=34508 RepID=A0A4V6A512_STECR|nr:hypothetical protein L596_013205 [Steinernema carpocapsae]
MAAKGVISFKTLERGKCERAADSQICEKIICEPKEGNSAILWTCLAIGTLAAVNEKDNKQSAYREWNAAFGNNGSWCHLHHDKEKESKALAAVCKDVTGEVYVGVIGARCVDLTNPTNVLIQGSVDAAKVKIDGQELWLSKTVLGAHSPFFAALFKNNKGMYNLKDLEDVKLEEFLQFLGIVHGFNMPIDKCSVESLLTLAELFQCKVVQRRCEHFLRSASSLVVTSAKKLFICDRFKLHGLLLDTFAEMPLEEIKKLRLPSGQSFSPLLSSVMSQKLRLVD